MWEGGPETLPAVALIWKGFMDTDAAIADMNEA